MKFTTVISKKKFLCLLILSIFSAFLLIILKQSKKRKFLCLLLLGFISVLQYIHLDLSCMHPKEVFSRSIREYIVACGTHLLMTLFFMLFTMRIHLACLISSCIFFVLSVINHYVFLFTSEPFTPLLFTSTRTGLNIMKGYSFTLDRYILLSFFCFLFEIVISIAIKTIYPGEQQFNTERFIFYFILFLFILIFIAICHIRLSRKTRWFFNINKVKANRSYITLIVQIALKRTKKLIMVPQGYNDEKLKHVIDRLPASPGKAKTFPDIILILNESFYDLNIYTEIKTDVQYLKNYRALEDAIKGYAITPYARNGTNDSEFELLTGLSANLFSQRAPFTTFSSFEKINSIARYLDCLGYSTQACHPCDPLNYNRKSVYHPLGFDKVRFYDDFTNHGHYGNRIETDEENYKDMIRWYEEGGDKPRFIYLLTFQNHGGYKQNDKTWDTVHIKENFGEVTDEVNEFLTSIQMSDEALNELFSYFDGIDRPVIVCMTGDHSPAFLSQIPLSKDISETEIDLRSKKVPFFIWGNKKFGRIKGEEGRMLGMTELLALVLDIAGLPLSPYYNNLLNLSRFVPVRMGDGYYQTTDGKEGILSSSDSLFDEISLPLYMAYVDLTDTSGEWDFLFSPKLS